MASSAAPLPIDAVLDDVRTTLAHTPNLVLIAPPGAGKTTRAAPALLDMDWARGGQILLLSPRRLAARAAAERIADELGVAVGDRVGYATRLDSRFGPRTQLLVMTHGVFRNRIQADPELSGVAAVLFDEVHERSLDSDFGLALALDAQGGLRPDLRLIAMSATLDGARFADLLGAAPVIESAGRTHPLEVRYLGRDPRLRIEDAMTAAIRRALAETSGGILAFLPGLAEINRTAAQLDSLGPDIRLHRLHGAIDPAQQRAAIRAEPDGARKLVLATAIAETSLTIDGISVVIDSGLARRARFDAAAGTSRLVTGRVSQAAATQRAGRAARQAPGIAYRLWEAAATQGLAPYDPPELLEADLASLVLDCARWGVRDPGTLRWLDPPPEPKLALARRALSARGALGPEGAITAHGRALADWPLPPHLADMMVRAGAAGLGAMAGYVAMLVSEYGLGGTAIDLDQRLDTWANDHSPRARAARATAQRWAVRAGSGSTLPSDAITRRTQMAQCIVYAFPDWIAKSRSPGGADWLSVGGRGFVLDTSSPLARAQWLAVADVQGAAGGAMIRAAVAIDAAAVETLCADRVMTRRHVHFDRTQRRALAQRSRMLGAIALATGPDHDAERADVMACLIDAVRREGVALLPDAPQAAQLRHRAAFAGLDHLSEPMLISEVADWLVPLLDRTTSLNDISPDALYAAWLARFDWDARRALDRDAPAQFVTPAGSHHDIDYAAPAGPTVTVRVQALYGLNTHPCIGRARTPLILSLTSPAGRPIQTTRDLPGFWRGSWREVAAEMRGRYPKHLWPENPASAQATLRTKRAAGL